MGEAKLSVRLLVEITPISTTHHGLDFTPPLPSPIGDSHHLLSCLLFLSCLQSELHQLKAHMNKLTNYLLDLLELTAKHLGHDLFIERMSLKQGPLSFTYANDGVNKEWWGLGHHCIISPLRMSPQI